MNGGLAAARHDTVLVTHDDCTVAPDWVGAAGRAGGRSPGRDRHRAGPAPRRRAATCRRPRPTPEPHDYTGTVTSGVLYPANMVASRRGARRRSAASTSGSSLPVAEDNDLCYRWLVDGRAFRYEPELVVWHHDWRTPEQLVRTHVAYARAQGGFYAKHLHAGDRRVLPMLALGPAPRLAQPRRWRPLRRRPRWEDPYREMVWSLLRRVGRRLARGPGARPPRRQGSRRAPRSRDRAGAPARGRPRRRPAAWAAARATYSARRAVPRGCGRLAARYRPKAQARTTAMSEAGRRSRSAAQQPPRAGTPAPAGKSRSTVLGVEPGQAGGVPAEAALAGDEHRHGRDVGVPGHRVGVEAQRRADGQEPHRQLVVLEAVGDEALVEAADGAEQGRRRRWRWPSVNRSKRSMRLGPLEVGVELVPPLEEGAAGASTSGGMRQGPTTTDGGAASWARRWRSSRPGEGTRSSSRNHTRPSPAAASPTLRAAARPRLGCQRTRTGTCHARPRPPRASRRSSRRARRSPARSRRRSAEAASWASSARRSRRSGSRRW